MNLLLWILVFGCFSIRIIIENRLTKLENETLPIRAIIRSRLAKPKNATTPSEHWNIYGPRDWEEILWGAENVRDIQYTPGANGRGRLKWKDSNGLHDVSFPRKDLDRWMEILTLHMDPEAIL